MAVLAMKRISIYALKSNRKKILELLQRRGAVEIDSPKEADDVFPKQIPPLQGSHLKRMRSRQ